MRLKDLTNQTFSRLTVVSYERKHGRTYWNCICSCGNKTSVKSSHLTGGLTQSCGCLQKELNAVSMRARKTKHGMSKRNTRYYPIYQSWNSMKRRCLDPKNNRYHCYGGRGIKVCESWMTFDNFRVDMASTWFIGATIDRINNDGNYEPTNCRWLPKAKNTRNKRK